MDRTISRCGVFLVLVLAGGCLGYAPARSEVGRAELSERAVYSYLEQSDLARPEIVQAVALALRQGKNYRERVLDQSSKWTLATVYIDTKNTLHVITTRSQKCPKCSGTGKRQWSNERMQNMPFDTRCLKCDGKGILEHETVPKQYLLGHLDYADPEAARAVINEAAFAKAPAEAEQYVEMLADDDPGVRMQACLWLDEHYVSEGKTFQEVNPMLRKARRRSQDDKVMVWQFWAGRDLPGEEARAYYRIYAKRKNGRIFRKGFFAAE